MILDRSMAPGLIFAMDPGGPARTYPGDTGDVRDALGVFPTAARSGGCEWTPGPFGQWLAFDGSTGFVATGFILPPTWSIGLVAASTSSLGFPMMVSANGTLGGDLDLEFGLAGSDSVIGSGSRPFPGTFPQTVDGNPHVYVITFDGANLDLWSDGVMASTVAAALSLAGPLYIGSLYSGSSFYDGNIGNLAIWNGVLSAGRISEWSANPLNLFRRHELSAVIIGAIVDSASTTPTGRPRIGSGLFSMGGRPIGVPRISVVSSC
jgi:Concanavalin A-like lectin/glucanases superfamily